MKTDQKYVMPGFVVQLSANKCAAIKRRKRMKKEKVIKSKVELRPQGQILSWLSWEYYFFPFIGIPVYLICTPRILKGFQIEKFGCTNVKEAPFLLGKLAARGLNCSRCTTAMVECIAKIIFPFYLRIQQGKISQSLSGPRSTSSQSVFMPVVEGPECSTTWELEN